MCITMQLMYTIMDYNDLKLFKRIENTMNNWGIMNVSLGCSKLRGGEKKKIFINKKWKIH